MGAVAAVEHMRKRADFLAARKGERRGSQHVALEVHDRGQPGTPPRLGLTVTKKVGNAPIRNRIRRRLREAVRVAVARDMEPGHDYVIVAREGVAAMPFEALVGELRGLILRPRSSRRHSSRSKDHGRASGKSRRDRDTNKPNGS